MILALTSFAGFGLVSLSALCTLIPGNQQTSNIPIPEFSRYHKSSHVS